jgi:hypothetical protein
MPRALATHPARREIDFVREQRLLIAGMLLALLAMSLGQAHQPLRTQQRRQSDQTVAARATLAQAPLMFIENIGQFTQAARYALYGSSTGLTLAEDGLWLSIRGRQAAPAPAGHPERLVRIKLSFVGANQRPQIEPIDRIDTHVAYYTGADPRAWRADVPAWSGARYRNLYPGVDLELSGANGTLSSKLIARRPADLWPVRMRVQGADDLALAEGSLNLATALGTFALPLPLAQTTDSAALPFADMAPSLQGSDVAHPFAGANPAAPAGGDTPQAVNGLEYSRLFGGNGSDEGGGIAVDSAGAAYVVGFTTSDNLAGGPGLVSGTPSSGYNSTVVKVKPDGSSLDYVAIIGGSGIEYANNIVLDSSRAAYIGGYTSSDDFPTTAGAFDTNGSGVGGNARDGFIFKLSPTADLVYSTYIGGSGDERANSIAVDSSGAAYLTGLTPSTNFPTTAGAFQETNNGADDAYVVKLKPDGSGIVFGTYLGGTGNERAADIKIDSGGALYVTGRSASANFPTLNAHDSGWNGGEDIFVTKLNPAGTSLVYSTLLGGSGDDNGIGIALDTNGAAYITGYTRSTDFPTLNAYNPNANGGKDAFAVKFDADGALAYASYLGGGGLDESTAIAVSIPDEVYIVGFTQSSSLPKTANGYATSLSGTQDAFLIKLKLSGPEAGLAYGTFLGGDHTDSAAADKVASDSGDAIAIDKDGGVYITGEAHPPNFPTTTGPAFGGGDNDSFVAKFQIGTPVAPTFTISGHVRTPAPASAPVVGVAVTAGSRSTVTDSNGAYQFVDLPPGDYTVRPSKANAAFSPASYFFNLSSSVSDKDFSLQTAIFPVSGRVTDSGGANGLAGVTISDGSGGTATTDANGSYSLSLTPGVYTLTPSRDNYIFTPPFRSVSVADTEVGVPQFTGAIKPPPKPQYISLMRLDSPVTILPCDELEPNNDRSTTTRELALGQPYQAKLCANDEDNYIVKLASATKPVITLTLPSTLREKTVIFVYNKLNLSPTATICGEGGLPKNTVITLTKCPLLPAGTSIVVRVYTDNPNDSDEQNAYSLLVTP